MSEVIDSKVVELKFNNAEFEKNVKTSLTTIEKLKKSLNFDTVTTSVNLLQNAFQLKGLKNIQTQLGQVVGAVDKSVSPIMATINTIGDAITNTIGGAISGVVAQIKSGGMNRAMNVEKAKFALQGLGIQWEEIKNSISDAVTGTAYGMDAAAKAASVLAGSGIDYKKVIGKDIVDTETDLTQMGMVLKSVSGVAAQTNQDFEQIAHVFSTIAGNGRLMGMQLTQLSTYGMNAAADIGDALGKTEEEVRDLVSKGKIGADQFFEIMYKKYWANSKKANDTLEGVSRNIRASYSRIGEAFYGPLIANQGPVVKMLNAYKDVIGVVANRLKAPGTKLKDGEGNKLTTFVTKWLIKDINLVTKFLTDIKNNGDVMKVWRAVYRVLKSGFKVFQMTFNFIRSIGMAIKQAFPESFLDYWIKVNSYIFKFTNIFYKGSKKIKQNADVMSKAFKAIRGVLEPIYKNVQNMTDAFKQFFDETFDGIDPLQTVVDTISDLCGYLHVGIVETEDWRKGFDALWGIVKHVYGVFKAFGEAVYETFKEGHFHPVKFLIELLHTLTDGIVSNDKKTKKLKNTFKIFTTAVGIVAKIFGTALLAVAKVFNILLRLGGWILYITSPIGTLVSKIFELVTGFTDAARNIDLDKYENLKKVREGVKDLFGKARDSVDKFVEKISDFTENNISKIKVDWPKAFDKVLSVLDNLAEKADKIKDKVSNGVGKAVDNIKKSIDNSFGKSTNDKIDSIKDGLEKIRDIDILGGIGKGLEKFWESIKKIFGKVKNSKLFSSIGEDLSGFFSNLGLKVGEALESEDTMDGLVKIAGAVAWAFSEIFKAIGKVLKAFTDEVLSYGSSDEVKSIIDDMVKVITALTVFNWSSAFSNLVSFAKNGKDWHVVTGFFNTVASVMETMSKSVLMISGSLYLLSTIDPKVLKTAKNALTGYLLLMAAIGVVFIRNKTTINGWTGSWSDKKIAREEYIIDKVAGIVLSLSASALIFAYACQILSKVPKDQLWPCAIVLGIAIGVLAFIANQLLNNKNMVQPNTEKKAMQIIKIAPVIKALAVAVLIVAAAIWVLGQLPVDNLDAAVNGMTLMLGAITVMMLVISVMIKKLTRTKGGDFSGSKSAPATIENLKWIFLSIAAVMISIGAAMLMITKAVAIMALIPEKMLDKSMSNMLMIMAFLGAIIGGTMWASNGITNEKMAINLAAVAGAIIALAAALLIFSIALQPFAIIKLETIAKGMVTLAAGLLTVIVAGYAAEGAALGLGVIAGVLIALAAAIGILVFSLIALGKAGPAAVAGIGIFFYAVGKGIGDFFKGLADAMGSILQGLWDCIVAVGAFLVEKGPEIVDWLGKFIVEIINTLFPKLLPFLGDVIGKIARGIGSILFGKEYVYEPYKGQLSDSLKKEIEGVYDDIKDSKEKALESIGVKDNDIQYYVDAWDKLKGMVNENGKIKKGYEDQAKTIVDELNSALGTTIEYDETHIKKLGKANKQIEKAIELKKAESYLDVFGEDYNKAIKDETELTKQYTEAFNAAKKSQEDLNKVNEQIRNLEKINVGPDPETLEYSAEQIDEMASLLKSIDPDRFTSEWVEANWADIPGFLDEEIAALRERAGEIAKVNANEELAMSKAAENLDSATSLKNGYEKLEKAMASGNTKLVEEMTLKLKYGFKEAADVTENSLKTQTQTYKQQLDEVNAVLKNDPHNKLFLEKQKELMKLYDLAREEEVKKANNTQEELDKIEQQEDERLDKNIAKKKQNSKKKAKAQTEGAKEGASEGAKEVAATITDTVNTEVANIDIEGMMKDPLSAIDSSGNLKLATDGGFDVGNNIMEGMANGITSFNMEDAVGDATNNVTELFKSKKFGFDVNSPSKLIAKRVGSPVMEGLAKGISDNVSMVKNPIAMVRDAVVNAFDSMALDSDYSPTITPVVDLSNVNSAAGSINGLFGNQSIGLSSNIGAVSASMREIQNTDKNAGLIAAINGLNGTTNNNVYNVNGITYDDGSNIADAVGQLINAAMIERRM